MGNTGLGLILHDGLGTLIHHSQIMSCVNGILPYMVHLLQSMDILVDSKVSPFRVGLGNTPKSISGLNLNIGIVGSHLGPRSFFCQSIYEKKTKECAA